MGMHMSGDDPRELRPRTTGEVLDDAWRLALADAPALLALSGLFAVPTFVVLLLLLTWPAPANLLVRLALPALAALLLPLTGLGSGACQELLRRRLEGTRVRLGGCLRVALGRAGGHLLGRGLTLLALLPGVAAGTGAVALASSSGAAGLLLLGGFGLFLSGIVLCLTYAIHPVVATTDLTPFAALGTALSRELQRGSTKAAAAAISRTGLLLITVVNLHLLVVAALYIAGELAGLETALLELLLALDNPVYVLSLVGLAWLLLAPFSEAVNHLLFIDGRVRHDGLDLVQRVRTLFPAAVLLLALAGLPTAARAQEDRREAVRGVRAEMRQLIDEVRKAEPYPGGARYQRRLESLGERLRGGAGDAERLRWFRAALNDFADRRREGALDILEDLDSKLSIYEESLGPVEGAAEERRSRADIKALLPGAREGTTAPPKKVEPPKDEELKRPTVRRDEPGEGGGGRGLVAPQAGGGGFGPLGWMLLAGLLLAVVAVAVVLWRQRSPATPGEAPAEDVPLPPTEAPAFQPEEQSAAELSRRAEALARRGEYLEALRCFYLAALTRLHEKELIRYERTRTNGEYLRQLRAAEEAREVAGAFGRLTRLFDRKWYGDRAANADDYERCRELSAELREAIEGR